MARRVRRNLVLGVGVALAAAVLALGRDEDRVAANLGRSDVANAAPAELAAPATVAAAAPAPAPVLVPEAAPVLPPPRPSPAPLAAPAGPTVDLARMELRGDRFVAPMSDGRTAVLTLDPAIQAVAEKVLKRARAPRGAIVVTHPDGRILALAGRRTEDPTGAGEGIDDPRMALEAWAPSASVFKVVSAAALVEAGVKRSDKVCYHGGVRSVTESNLGNSPQDSRCEDLAFGVSHSQNAIIAKLVHQHVAPRQLAEVARRLGFGRALPLPTAAEFGKVDVPDTKGLDFARTAAGFTGVELSAVGGALLANTVATGGVAAPPRLIAAYLDGDAETPSQAGAPERVLEETVADELAVMMAETCTDGSAAKAFTGRDRIPGVEVAGKTGTLSGSEPFYMQYSWFVGFAPTSKPQLSVSVILGNPEKWQLKAHTAARMVLVEALRSRAGS
ncbi:MAG: penicillin-binding transpeptidase domain-containing protein [Kofleriaceae bacterium]